jgi:hypothetical protein
VMKQVNESRNRNKSLMRSELHARASMQARHAAELWRWVII